MKTTGRNRHIPLDEKLSALQQADPARSWSSLDDRRICARCERIISGRMIDIWQDERGAYHLHCPTAGCEATPDDWFHHGMQRAASRRLAAVRATTLELGLAIAS